MHNAEWRIRADNGRKWRGDDAEWARFGKDEAAWNCLAEGNVCNSLDHEMQAWVERKHGASSRRFVGFRAGQRGSGYSFWAIRR